MYHLRILKGLIFAVALTLVDVMPKLNAPEGSAPGRLAGTGIKLSLCPLFFALVMGAAGAQNIPAPEPRTGTIIGTVTNVRDDIVPGATIVLQGPGSSDQRTVVANDDGFFQLTNVKPGIPYHVTVSDIGFINWTSPEITLTPGQYLQLTDVKLKIAVVVTTVAVVPDSVQLATQQVEIEEKQRVFGVIPNFYVVYDKNPVPLTAKLKFRLALRTSIDPVSIVGVAFISALDQAGDTPDFQQGWKGYAQRFGTNYADGLTDIMIGGAILPSILHQDPRYFYQGTGTKKSRALHAVSSSFVCRGDNRRKQPNYSSLGGYLASGAISELYYPESNRGPGLVFQGFALDVAADMANDLIQEFLLRKLTPSAKHGN
jgi:Carboxypeptidase regulatory-like domain